MSGVVSVVDTSQPLRMPSGARTKLQPSMKLRARTAAAEASCCQHAFKCNVCCVFVCSVAAARHRRQPAPSLSL